MTRSNSIRYRRNGTFYTPGLSGLFCRSCDLPFMAGAVPSDGQLVCKQCRDLSTAESDPGLFAIGDVQPSERGGDSDPT